MKISPLVSVVIPYFKGRDYIKETLVSLIQQTFQEWECLLIDDYSPSDAQDICLSLNDNRIKYIKNDGSNGMAHARNKGCTLASGRYIALCDQDDVSLPQRFFKQVEFLQKNPDIFLVGSWRKNFGTNNEFIRHEINPEKIKIRLLGNSQFTNPSIMFRSELIKDYGLYFNQDMAPADDYDFICRVSSKRKITNIPRVLLNYRIHEKQISSQLSHILEEKALLIRKNYIRSILSRWIPHGLDVDTMSQVFSKGCKLKVSQKDLLAIFNQWYELNMDYPLWEEQYWNSFLGERFLMTLNVINMSKINKLKSLLIQRKLIWCFLTSHNFKAGVKLLLRSVFK